MAIAKRGTRVIHVDGERYRWRVAPNDEPGLALVVLHDEAVGQRMAAWFDHGTIISPALVAASIRDALSHHAWTPRQRGRQLTLRCAQLPPGVGDREPAGRHRAFPDARHRHARPSDTAADTSPGDARECRPAPTARERAQGHRTFLHACN